MSENTAREVAGLKSINENLLEMIAGGAMDAGDEEQTLEAIRMAKSMDYSLDGFLAIFDDIDWESPEERAEYYDFVVSNW